MQHDTRPPWMFYWGKCGTKTRFVREKQQQTFIVIGSKKLIARIVRSDLVSVFIHVIYNPHTQEILLGQIILSINVLETFKYSRPWKAIDNHAVEVCTYVFIGSSEAPGFCVSKETTLIIGFCSVLVNSVVVLPFSSFCCFPLSQIYDDDDDNKGEEKKRNI